MPKYKSNSKEEGNVEDAKLKDAVAEFRVKYIDMVAGHTLKKSIKDLSRVLDHDRSELSRIVNSAENKGMDLEFRKDEKYTTLEESITRGITDYKGDSKIKEIFERSINEGLNFNLKTSTDRFKNIHIKRVVDSSFSFLEENYGLDFANKYAIKHASKKLGINERTVKDRLTKFDKVNSIIESFSKDISKEYELE